MLPRVLGEDIELRLLLGKDLGSIRCDPAQLERMLLNLTVNARDAMPNGGTLTIATQAGHVGGAFQSEASLNGGMYCLRFQIPGKEFRQMRFRKFSSRFTPLNPRAKAPG